MIEFLQNNYQLIFVIMILGLLIWYLITNPYRIKEWLIGAVTLAEKEWGSGTGAIKLRVVYDSFITKYSIVGKFIPFSVFSDWVDIALKFMREQLEKNNNVKEKVEN